ncbi:MAG: VCBS repeat-containing protein [Chloroflexota bacterium]
MSPNSFFLSFLALCSILQATPVSVRAWDLDSATFIPASLPAGTISIQPPAQADLNADGVPESLSLADGRLAIQMGNQTVWESPNGWDVVQAAFTDLNQDGLPEAALLVWRAFQPWPVDEFLPYGGRIADFHDGEGNSCHLIMIGWIHGEFGELWAGSALADPITAFAAADLDGDALQELITLEAQYTGRGSGPGNMLKVWEWNGFGFTVVSSVEGSFSSLALARQENGRILILTP